MKIEIANRQTTLRLNVAKIRSLTRLLARRAGDRLPEGGRWGEISLVVTDDPEIVTLNERFFGRRETTDVISLPLASVPGDDGKTSGEIFVNAEQAIRGADAIKGGRSRNWDLSKELALYIAHGCDHLTGASDSDRRSAARMRRRELRWIARAGESALLEGLAEARRSDQCPTDD